MNATKNVESMWYTTFSVHTTYYTWDFRQCAMHSYETGMFQPYEEDDSAGNHNGKISTDENQHKNQIKESKTRNQSLVIDHFYLFTVDMAWNRFPFNWNIKSSFHKTLNSIQFAHRLSISHFSHLCHRNAFSCLYSFILLTKIKIQKTSASLVSYVSQLFHVILYSKKNKLTINVLLSISTINR